MNYELTANDEFSGEWKNKEHRLHAIEQMYTDFTSLYREVGHAPVMSHSGDLPGR